MRFCPAFLIDVATSLSAKAFIENHYTLEHCCSKTFEHLSRTYDDNFSDIALNIADFKLRILLAAGIENAAGLFYTHSYTRLHYKRDLAVRHWNSAFSDPLKPQKNATTEKQIANRDFVAFVFNYKNAKVKMAPEGWTVSSCKTCSVVNEMGQTWD